MSNRRFRYAFRKRMIRMILVFRQRPYRLICESPNETILVKMLVGEDDDARTKFSYWSEGRLINGNQSVRYRLPDSFTSFYSVFKMIYDSFYGMYYHTRMWSFGFRCLGNYGKLDYYCCRFITLVASCYFCDLGIRFREYNYMTKFIMDYPMDGPSRMMRALFPRDVLVRIFDPRR
jgi:hypothetical protein